MNVILLKKFKCIPQLVIDSTVCLFYFAIPMKNEQSIIFFYTWQLNFRRIGKSQISAESQNKR